LFPGERKLYPHCLVLVGSRNGFEPDITIKLNIEGLNYDLNDKKASSVNIVKTKTNTMYELSL